MIKSGIYLVSSRFSRRRCRLENKTIRVLNHYSIRLSQHHSIKKSDHQNITPFYLLPVIIFSQFAGTSLWFAGNAILPDLQEAFQLPVSALGNITSAIQFGFISGTLTFAFLLIADRFSPSKVFLVSAILGALCNLLIFLFPAGFTALLLFRFMTGFFLAGIYPVGMKISADWYAKDLGKALGYLVGALVLGKAFPFFLKNQAQNLPWHFIIIATSALAVLGGLLIYFLVGDGPNRTKGSQFQPKVIAQIFQFPKFRAAALGYFGHMWELYTFWAFTPLILETFNRLNPQHILSIPFWSFLIIALGTLGCIVGGYLSQRIGSAKVAFGMLFTSGLCCLFSPALFQLAPPLFLIYLLIWGFSVVGDSAQFSTLVAQTAPKEYIGSALTIVNCIGFSITIISIEVLNAMRHQLDDQFLYLLLVVGPIFGLLSIKKLLFPKMPVSPS